jgi:hypothetical protein
MSPDKKRQKSFTNVILDRALRERKEQKRENKLFLPFLVYCTHIIRQREREKKKDVLIG